MERNIRPHKFPYTVVERKQALQRFVESCRAAARERGIREDQELKSILFKSTVDGMFIMAHVPGDMIVNEERLKELFGACEIVPRDSLGGFGLQKGRVNPFTAELYLGDNVLHVVSNDVFLNQWLWTNNDELDGSIQFRPEDLVHWLDSLFIRDISLPKH